MSEAQRLSPNRQEEQSFEFSNVGENSIGSFFKGIFANSNSDIPEAIQVQFNNPNALPKEFQSIPTNIRSTRPPVTETDPNASTIPREYIQPISKLAEESPEVNNNSNTINNMNNINSINNSNNTTPNTDNTDNSVNTENNISSDTNNSSNAESENLSIVPTLPDTGQQYCDITDYLNMPQSLAAKKLQIPSSTLSKRWKEAARSRKWPWRTVRKIDKEITTLLHNIPPGGAIPEEIESNLAQLLRKRQDELKPVVIRL